tara:strand:+ start:289 stop:567 length:279 start_codon:yes stop_codon:yes gene_type:complete
MEWIQIAVLILAGSGSELPPSTSTIYTKTFSSIMECEANLVDMRLHSGSNAKRVKTSGIGGEYEQIVVTTPVNLTGFGEGLSHYSCIPISFK